MMISPLGEGEARKTRPRGRPARGRHGRAEALVVGRSPGEPPRDADPAPPAAAKPSTVTRAPRAAAALAIAAVLVWVNLDDLREMAGRWQADARYSHGYLIVPFSLYLLWSRRALLEGGSRSPSWWGMAGFGAGAALKYLGLRYHLQWPSAISFLPCLAGLALLTGGWRTLRWAWPAIAFLVFMVPLPFRVEAALGAPARGLTTQASAYLLQAMGRPAFAEGYIIHVGHARIGVVEACNGLGMLITTLTIATAVAFLSKRSVPVKLALILSAVPIALAANVGRVTVTGLLHEWAGGRVADAVFHDLAGWLSMPLILAALCLVSKILGNLLVEAGPDLLRDIPVGVVAGIRASPRGRASD